MRIIEVILQMLRYKGWNQVISLLKKHWFKYYLTALRIISVPIVVYVGAYAIIAVKEFRNFETKYINREPVKTNATIGIVEFIEDLIIKTKVHGITISWISITTPDIKSDRKHLEFVVVRGCDFNRKPDNCLTNGKTINPQYYCNEENEDGCYYDLSAEDGRFLENDKIVLFDPKNPIDFADLEPVSIPIYKNGTLSFQFRAFAHIAPKIFKLVSTNRVPEDTSTYTVFTKVRDVTFANKRVIYVVVATKWSDNDLTVEGMEQMVMLIARKIKNNILIL